MKLTRGRITAIASGSLVATLALTQNFISSLQPYEVEPSPSAVPLSSIVRATPGTIDEEKDVVIQPGEAAYIDASINVRKLTIQGQLLCSDSAAPLVEIKARTIVVNGVFQCGTSVSPYLRKLFISLKDDGSGSARPSADYRGLVIYGKLILNGNRRNVKWARLQSTAEPGSVMIRLDQYVGENYGWASGDEIVIGPSSYDYREAETFRITRVDPWLPNVVYLDKPLKYRHWGQLQTIWSPNSQTGTRVDQRAEVANLTRNIVIRADRGDEISEEDLPGAQLGGHVVVHYGGFAAIDSVEFYRMGQAGIMGRYPFHWHLVENAQGQFIRNSSIHRSFQRCIVLHGTSLTTVSNNVCYDFRGHGFFLEDGNEVQNTLSGNLGILARHPTASKILLESDNPNAAYLTDRNTRVRFPPTSVFWISNPLNKVIGNVASGSVGVGFWNTFAQEIDQIIRDPDPSQAPNFEDTRSPASLETLAFEGNVAHSALVGMTWDGAPVAPGENTGTGNPNNPEDRKIDISHYWAPKIPVFRNLSVYKNLHTGIYFRGHTAVFDRSTFADNGVSAFFAYNQILRDSVIVGQSANHGDAEKNFLISSESFLYHDNSLPDIDEYDIDQDGNTQEKTGRILKRQSGIYMYDGPFELENVSFLNFSTKRELVTDGTKLYDFTSVPIASLSGADEFTNLARGVTFYPEPVHRVFLLNNYSKVEKLRDHDGSITGVPGAMLLSRGAGLSLTSQCVPGGERFKNFYLCPPPHSDSTVLFQGGSNAIPFIVRRSDGVASRPQSQWNDVFTGAIGTSSNPFDLLNGDGYTYEILAKPARVSASSAPTTSFVAPPPLDFYTHSDNFDRDAYQSYTPTTRLSVIKLVGYGSNCSLPGAIRVKSVADLRSATRTSYYSLGNDFYVRVVNDAKSWNRSEGTPGVSKETQSDPIAVCNGPVEYRVLGSSWLASDFAGPRLDGMACEYGWKTPSEVRIYAGGPESSGTLIANLQANLTPAQLQLNDPQASQKAADDIFACGITRPSTAGFRFKWVIPHADAVKYNGKRIYLHGVAATAWGANQELSGSGRYKISCDLAKIPAQCKLVDVWPYLVRYGAAGRFKEREFYPGTVVGCNNRTFGDPIYGVAKACYNQQGRKLAEEDTLFVPCGVKYGANDQFYQQLFTTGFGVQCTNQTFGDPIYGMVKACYSYGGYKMTNEGQFFNCR